MWKHEEEHAKRGDYGANLVHNRARKIDMFRDAQPVDYQLQIEPGGTIIIVRGKHTSVLAEVAKTAR
jgi:hypothetical protein